MEKERFSKDRIPECVQSFLDISFSEYKKECKLLCTASDFLVRFCRLYPEIFRMVLAKYKQTPYTKKIVKNRLDQMIPIRHSLKDSELMQQLRIFKKTELLFITLRFLTGITDIEASMRELTTLAEVILEFTLSEAIRICNLRYGDAKGEFVIIALGKLGAEELNYSSDIDIVGFYKGDPLMETSGILFPSGVRGGKITLHEYYSKVMELLTKLLSTETNDGFVYRVDLRLRPQGQRGPLVQTLQSAIKYYLTWGRVWERMVLIRARAVAGDMCLAEEFSEGISSFVWERRLDYGEIEEIRQMKKKFDAIFTKEDIKRGYGGIREIEFFVNTLQLLYSPEFPSLRTHKTKEAIYSLIGTGLFSEKELLNLWQCYLYLRTVEQLIQMQQDLQTHKLPKEQYSLERIAKLMGYKNNVSFLSHLKVKRLQVKKMYNDLLGTEKEIYAETLSLLTDDYSKEELQMYMSFRGAIESDKVTSSILNIRDIINVPDLQSNQQLIREVLPMCLSEAFNSPNIEEAIFFIEDILKSAKDRITFLQWFQEEPIFIKGLIRLVSISSYMRRLISAEPVYISYLIEDPSMRKNRSSLRDNINRFINNSGFVPETFVKFRQTEQLRAGIFYAAGVFTDSFLQRTLTKVADVVLEEAVKRIYQKSLPLVIGLGKLGSREMDFQSDIDILIIDEEIDHKKAEELLKLLTQYTPHGPAFQVDLRLRADGSKGPLVHSLASYFEYYRYRAMPWEIQALLKARPITGDPSQRQLFMRMIKTVFDKRASELTWDEISAMRKRIINEISKETHGIDIKFGPGGLEDIEFFIQYLILKHKQFIPNISTLRAIKRLSKIGKLQGAEQLDEVYRFLRKLYTILRLNEEAVLRDTEKTISYARFLGLKNKDHLFTKVNSYRESALKIISQNMSASK